MGKLFEAITKTAPASDRKTGSPGPPPEGIGGGRGRSDAAPLRQTAAAGGAPGTGTKRSRDGLFAGRVAALDDKLVAVNDSFSPAAESFRRLRTKLLHPAAGKAPRSILITSVAPNEGKGFVAANLAATLAQGVEQHALVVDCDFRRPSLAGLFGLSNERGLADHLQDGTSLGSLIRKTEIPKLSVIPAGPPPSNPSELLDSEKMAAAVEELIGRYPDRFVIIDSPPMDMAAETAVLARHVDGVVLVVRWGVAGREQVKKLAAAVGKDKIAGVVFNGVQVNEIESRLYRYKGSYEYAGYHPS
ncbi:MAG: polysaccharide biosynthesis tyrosine autokinase [Desulfobacteraceae bacterium]|nr:polysaccharide biosynthesis tyrosine autokinase [Desulfobacteraceae bacterium]